MNLILEVISCGAQSAHSEPRKVFGIEGGHIGRSPDCDWVLPSPFISRHHATVCCVDDVFYIVSTGQNGVALNDAAAMLSRFEHQALKSGDRLFIDDYEVTVEISQAASAVQPGVLSALLLSPEAAQSPSQPQILPTSTSRSRVPPVDVTAHENNTGAHPTGGSHGMFDLSTVLLGAGIEPDTLSPETAGMLGSLLRPLVQSLIEALHTRADLRSQLRLPVTGIQISEDDPLRLEIDVGDVPLAQVCERQHDSERTSSESAIPCSGSP